MNKKLLGILVVACSLFILVGVIYVMFFSDRVQEVIAPERTIPELSKEPEKKESQLPVEPAKKEIKANISNKPILKKEEVNESDLKRIAASFAERFGSYSNQSNFSNIEDLKIFMSRRMQRWSDSFIKQAREKDDSNSIYYGITTKAIFQEVIKFDDNVGLAQILVKTQRREATGTMTNTTSFYQDISISFLKESGMWKVDSANWQVD